MFTRLAHHCLWFVHVKVIVDKGDCRRWIWNLDGGSVGLYQCTGWRSEQTGWGCS